MNRILFGRFSRRGMIAGWLMCVGAGWTTAFAQVCSETPAVPASLGSPSGCSLCLNRLLAGTLEPGPDTHYYIESDLPETLLSTGVLYSTTPVLPADRSGNPLLAMRTQVVSGGFTTIDDSFDVLLWHTSSPGGGSQPRRIVVYVRNDGTGSVQVNPQKIIISDGGYTTMSATLGTRVLEDNWDVQVSSVALAAGAGDVVAWSKQFAASSNNSDKSTNVNCFGRVRAMVQNPDPVGHPTNLEVYVVAIDGADAAQNKTRAEALLNTGATSGDPFDLNTPPADCANRRATGVFDTFTWRNDPLTVNSAALSDDGMRFRMTLGEVNSQNCPAGQQTADLVLRPGYVRPDTIGNYMVDYRVAFRVINTNPDFPRAVDLRFVQSSATVGLGWQVAVGEDAPSDATVDAQPARTAWTSDPSALERSFLEYDGGPIVVGPCEAKVIAVRFLILGGSSLPFDLRLLPVVPSEYIVDNTDSACQTIGGWTASTLSGYYGTNSLVHAGNSGRDKATSAFYLLATGQYDVYAWWVAASNRAVQAPFDVHHLTGVTRVLKDQTSGGSAWNLLGSFAFQAGTNAAVRLSDDVPAAQYVSADAIRLVYTGPIERVVDNRDAACTFVGTWPTSGNSGYWGTDSQYHTGDGGASSATWRPNLPYAGRYRVQGWWIVSSNRAPQAPYTINHRTGAATVYANQTDVATMNKWNDLGEFEFEAGTAGSVVLSTNVPSAQYVSADAVRFLLVSAAPPTPADLDGDGDVDLGDYAPFSDCLTGPGIAPGSPDCTDADLDDDGDVDLADFSQLSRCFDGSRRPPACSW